MEVANKSASVTAREACRLQACRKSLRCAVDYWEIVITRNGPSNRNISSIVSSSEVRLLKLVNMLTATSKCHKQLV